MTVTYTGSRAVRYLTRLWGENFATNDIARESERFVRVPLEKHVEAGRLFLTQWGLSPSNIPTVSHVEIPECCRWLFSRPLQRKGSVQYDESWFKILLAISDGKRTPFGKKMQSQKVLELILKIPFSAKSPQSTTLNYDHTEDVLVSDPIFAVPTISGWKFRAGQMFSAHKAVWLRVSDVKAKKNISQVLNEGWSPPACAQVVPVWFDNHKLESQESQAWDTEVVTLLQMGAIKQITRDHVLQHGLPQVVLPIFLVAEKDKYRPITDARYSNIPFLPPWFSLPKISQFLDQLTKDVFWFKCDVKGGWHHIPIAQQHSNFFAFEWRGGLYQYTVCPFGDATAPYIFTYMLISLKKMLKAKQIEKFILYIDDLLVPGFINYEKTTQLRTKVIAIQHELNLALGAKKCPLPSQVGEALGFWVDTEQGIVTFTAKKFDNILGKIVEIESLWQQSKKVHVRKLASLVGKIVSGLYLCKHTLGFIRDVTQLIINETRDSNWETYVLDSPTILQGAREWVLFCKANPRRLWFNPLRRVWFSSDATPTTASAVFWGEGPEFCPLTKEQTVVKTAFTQLVEESPNIAVTEAFAIVWGWKALLKDFQEWMLHHNLGPSQVEVCWATDNQVCQHAFTKMLSGQKEIDGFTKNFLREIIIKENWLFSFVWLPSEINFLADSLSRPLSMKDEWDTPSFIFAKIKGLCKQRCLPFPTVDAFASKINKKFQRYCSLHGDIGSLGVFPSSTLRGETLWCNPPYTWLGYTIANILMNKFSAWVLCHICDDTLLPLLDRALLKLEVKMNQVKNTVYPVPGPQIPGVDGGKWFLLFYRTI